MCQVSRINVLWIAVLCILIGSGCSDTTPLEEEETSAVLAEVGSRSITVDDVMASVLASDGAISPQESLNRLIRRNALIEAGLAAGLDNSPEVIQAWENALIRELRRSKLETAIRDTIPSERDLRTIYERDFESFQQPESRKLAFVLVSEEEAMDSLLEKWHIMEDLPAESGFGELAYQFSTHQASRFSGGVIGWLQVDSRPSGVPVEVIDIGFTLQDNGELSTPISTPEGWALVRMIDQQPSRLTSFEDARPTLEAKAKRELRENIEANFFRETIDNAGVQLRNEDILQSLKPETKAPHLFP